MPNTQNLQGLYNTLISEGYTPPAFDEFVEDMAEDKNLRGVYATLQKEGYTPPDYGQFVEDMGFGVASVSAAAPAPLYEEAPEFDWEKGQMDFHHSEQPIDLSAPVVDSSESVFDDVNNTLVDTQRTIGAVGRSLSRAGNIFGDRVKVGESAPSRLSFEGAQKSKAERERRQEALNAPMSDEEDFVNAAEGAREWAEEKKAEWEYQKFLDESERERRSKPLDPDNPYTSITVGEFEDRVNDAAVGTAREFGSKAIADVMSVIERAGDSVWEPYIQRVKDDPFSTEYDSSLNLFGEANKAEGIAEDAALRDAYMAKMKSRFTDDVDRVVSSKAFQERIAADANRLGYDKDYYETKVVEALNANYLLQLREALVRRNMPKDVLDYIMSGMEQSITGMVVSRMNSTKDQWMRMQEGIQLYADENAPGFWASGLNMGVSMATDAPIFRGLGVGSGVLLRTGGGMLRGSFIRLLANGTGKTVAGIERGVQSYLTTNFGARVGANIMQHGLQGGLTLGGYEALNTVTRQALSGYFDVGEIGSSFGSGFMFGASMSPVSVLGGELSRGVLGSATANASKISRVFKAGAAEAVKFGAEGLSFAIAEQTSRLVRGEELLPWDEALGKSFATVIALKLTNPMSIGELNRAYDYAFNPEKYDYENREYISFTRREREQLKKHTGRKGFFGALQSFEELVGRDMSRGERARLGDAEYLARREELERAYRALMDDPEIDYVTKQKIAVIGGGVLQVKMPAAAKVERVWDEASGRGEVILRDGEGRRIMTDTFRDKEKMNAFADEQARVVGEETIAAGNNIELEPTSWNMTYMDMRRRGMSYKELMDSRARIERYVRALQSRQRLSIDRALFTAVNDADKEPEEYKDKRSKSKRLRQSVKSQNVRRREALPAAQEELVAAQAALTAADRAIMFRWADYTMERQSACLGRMQPYAEAINARINKDTHTIMYVTTRNGKKGNVVAGHIVTDGNGHILVGDSDQTIVFIDEGGNAEMLSPKDIGSVDRITTPEVEMEEAAINVQNDVDGLADRNSSKPVEGASEEAPTTEEEHVEEAPTTEEVSPVSVDNIKVGDRLILRTAGGKIVHGTVDEIDEQGFTHIKLDEPADFFASETIYDDMWLSKGSFTEYVVGREGAPISEEPTMEEPEVRRYEKDEDVTILLDGEEQSARIIDKDVDGKLLVYVGATGYEAWMSPEELSRIEVKKAPEEVETPVETTEESAPEGGETPQSVLATIPKDEQGNPNFEAVAPDVAFAGLVEQEGGNRESATKIAEVMAKNKHKAVDDAEKAVDKASKALEKAHEDAEKDPEGDTPAAISADMAAKRKAVEAAERALADAQDKDGMARMTATFWENVLKEAQKTTEDESAPEDEEAPEKKPVRKGGKQISKYMRLAEEASEKGDIEGLSRAIAGFDANVFRGAEPTAEETALMDTYRQQIRRAGYEMVDYMLQPYAEGMELNADFRASDDYPKEVQIITGVSRPQLNRDGRMVQSANVMVTIGTPSFENEQRKAALKERAAAAREKQSRGEELTYEERLDIAAQKQVESKERAAQKQVESKERSAQQEAEARAKLKRSNEEKKKEEGKKKTEEKKKDKQGETQGASGGQLSIEDDEYGYFGVYYTAPSGRKVLVRRFPDTEEMRKKAEGWINDEAFLKRGAEWFAEREANESAAKAFLEANVGKTFTIPGNHFNRRAEIVRGDDGEIAVDITGGNGITYRHSVPKLLESRGDVNDIANDRWKIVESETPSPSPTPTTEGAGAGEGKVTKVEKSSNHPMPPIISVDVSSSDRSEKRGAAAQVINEGITKLVERLCKDLGVDPKESVELTPANTVLLRSSINIDLGNGWNVRVAFDYEAYNGDYLRYVLTKTFVRGERDVDGDYSHFSRSFSELRDEEPNISYDSILSLIRTGIRGESVENVPVEATPLKETLDSELRKNAGKRGKVLSDRQVKAIKLDGFVDDPIRPVMHGIYYKDGYAVASDGYVLIKVRMDYPKEYEGKIIGAKDGKEIEGRYPNADSVLNGLYDAPNKKKVDIGTLEKDYALAKELSALQKGDNKDITIGVRIPAAYRGEHPFDKYDYISINYKNLGKLLNAADATKGVEVYSIGDRMYLVGDGIEALAGGYNPEVELISVSDGRVYADREKAESEIGRLERLVDGESNERKRANLQKQIDAWKKVVELSPASEEKEPAEEVVYNWDGVTLQKAKKNLRRIALRLAEELDIPDDLLLGGDEIKDGEDTAGSQQSIFVTIPLDNDFHQLEIGILFTTSGNKIQPYRLHIGVNNDFDYAVKNRLNIGIASRFKDTDGVFTFDDIKSEVDKAIKKARKSLKKEKEGNKEQEEKKPQETGEGASAEGASKGNAGKVGGEDLLATLPERAKVKAGNVVHTEKEVGKLKLKNYTRTDQPQKVLAGINYKDGYITACNGSTLIRVRADYPKEYEGKTIDPRNGKEIDDKYPDPESVLNVRERGAEKLPLNMERLRKDMEVAEQIGGNEVGEGGYAMPTAILLESKHGNQSKWKGYNYTPFKTVTLKKLLDVMGNIGNVEAYVSGDRLYFVGDGVEGCMMGIDPDAIDSYTSGTQNAYIDKGKVKLSSYGRSQAEHALGEAESALRAAQGKKTGYDGATAAHARERMEERKKVMRSSLREMMAKGEIPAGIITEKDLEDPRVALQKIVDAPESKVSDTLRQRAENTLKSDKISGISYYEKAMKDAGRSEKVKQNKIAKAEKVVAQWRKLLDMAEDIAQSDTQTDREDEVVDSGEEIDDWGEKLEGARKFALGEIAEKMKNVNVQNLIALPLSKVFPKRDFAKQVEQGKITKEDALLLEALQQIVYSKKKPVLKGGYKRSYSEREIAKWAQETYVYLDYLRRYCDAETPEARRAVREEMLSNDVQERAERAERGKRIEGSRGDYTEDDYGFLFTPNRVKSLMDILDGLGYPTRPVGQTRFPEIEPSWSFSSYEVRLPGTIVRMRVPSYEEAIECATKIAKQYRGDDDVAYTSNDFGLLGEKEIRKETGRYYVNYTIGRGGLEYSKFDTKEAAERFIKEREAQAQERGKKFTYELVPEEGVVGYEKYHIAVMDYRNVVKEKLKDAGEFASEEEARAFIDGNMPILNEMANNVLTTKYNTKEKREEGADLFIQFERDENHRPIPNHFAVYLGVPFLKKGNTTISRSTLVSKGFKSWKEANDWIKEHRGEIEERIKVRDAVIKALNKESFFAPEKPRKGTDWRKGKDVTAEEFGDTFGFRGVQFGNWTDQADRQRALNEAYDAFMDLAEFLGVSPRALSLAGELGIAFGSRGTGWANAHYEIDNVVINLTKTRGAGSLAHEWWHALDNYFSRRGGVSGGFLTDMSGRDARVRNELRAAYKALTDAIEKSAYHERSDSRGPYWGKRIEETARLFAEWVHQSMNERGKNNSFLARGMSKDFLERYIEANRDFYNSVQGTDLSLEEFKKLPQAYASWPEPLEEEVREFSPLLQKIVDTIEEKVEDGKTILFRDREDEVVDSGNAATVEEVIESLEKRFNHRLRRVESLDEVTDRSARRKIERDEKNGTHWTKGWYDPKTDEMVIYMPNCSSAADAARTVLHEMKGHKGLRAVLGEQFSKVMRDIYRLLPDEVREGVKREADRMYAEALREGDGRAQHSYDYYTEVATEEHLSRTAEDDAPRPEWWRRALARIRAALRQLGFNVKVSDADINYLLWRAEDKLRAEGKGVFDRAEDISRRERAERERRREQASEETRFSVEEGENKRSIDDVSAEAVEAAERGNGAAVEKALQEVSRMQSKASATLEALKGAKGDAAARAAIRARAVEQIGASMSSLKRAMSQQRQYDKESVAALSRLAKQMLEAGLISEPSQSELKRLLSLMPEGVRAMDAQGRAAFGRTVDGLFDIMASNQWRNAQRGFSDLLKTKGFNAKSGPKKAVLDDRGNALLDELRGMLNAKRDGLAAGVDRDMLTSRKWQYENDIAEDEGVEATKTTGRYEAMSLLEDYYDNVLSRIGEERDMRREIEETEAARKKGEIDDVAARETIAALEDAIRESVMSRSAALGGITGRLRDMLGESKGAVKKWQKAQMTRKSDIIRDANADGRRGAGRVSMEVHRKPTIGQRVVNNGIVQFFTAALPTFDMIFRMYGRNNVNGEGRLWRRFTRQGIEASDTEYKEHRRATDELDAKVSAVYGKKGMKWSDLFSLSRKTGNVSVWVYDNVKDAEGKPVKQEKKLTQGQLTYIYMVNKMTDGKMKLRRMGISEEDVAGIVRELDPRMVELADWLQDEFFPSLMERYNVVHRELFGVSMEDIPQYVPLRIQKRALVRDEELTSISDTDKLPSTMTGSIIQRTKNTLPIDIMNADAFGVVADHVRDMSHWMAYAQMNKDLCTLLSYKKFRNQTFNMTTIMGGGDKLWERVKTACVIASGNYRPQGDRGVDALITNIAKGVSSAQITMRLFTAFKQLASMSAGAHAANWGELVKSFGNPIGSWRWAMRELPGFERRWMTRIAGETRLLPTESDYGFWRTNVVQRLQRIGMAPNAFVDCLTVAGVARGVYNTRYKGYIRDGYAAEEADRMAKDDAAIVYNETQQSAESMFNSSIQKDNTVASNALTVFNNATFGYGRQALLAISNLSKMLTPGYRGQSLAYMSRQHEKQGLSEAAAAAAARREYRRAWGRNLIAAANFAVFLPALWQLFSVLPQKVVGKLLGGDDEEDDMQTAEDILKYGLCHSVDGAVLGKSLGDLLYSVATEGGIPYYYDNSMLPLLQNLEQVRRDIGSDRWAALHDAVNLIAMSATGYNLGTIETAVEGIYNACGQDEFTTRDAALMVMSVCNVPKSQRDKVYFDQLGMSAKDAERLTPKEVAERYAMEKAKREAGWTWFLHSAEDRDSAFERALKRGNSLAKERAGRYMSDDVRERYNAYMDEYNELKGKKVLSGEERRRVVLAKMYDSALGKLAKLWLSTDDALRADDLAARMIVLRSRFVELWEGADEGSVKVVNGD